MRHDRKMLPEAVDEGWLYECRNCKDLYIGHDPDVENVEGCKHNADEQTEEGTEQGAKEEAQTPEGSQ